MDVEGEIEAEIRSAGDRFEAREAADPDRYPAESVAELVALGLFSAPFPRELGGLGLDLPRAVAVLSALSETSPSLGLLASMPVGLAGVLATSAPALPEAVRPTFLEQVSRVAGDFGAGGVYAACNSEKGAGGSIDAIRTVARLRDGGYRLTGEKILASFSTAKLPEGGVELFFVDTRAPGVTVHADWDGFGMRSTEGHSVRYDDAPAREMVGYPGFLGAAQPFSWWYCLFAAIPLGCVASMIRALGTPAPSSPALRLRLSEALMRYEAARAYLLDSASLWRPGGDEGLRARMLRAKTYVTQESARIAADLFALSGGRHYTRTGHVARRFAGTFAGTALRPPLPLALDLLVDGFSLGPLDVA
jgi:alkylation response protein AidB-like acyl-CoA dehydrogenase